MIFGAARVAPEKAVFRPALPMSFLPGISEMRMATYFEKLKDPRWQKKRLEALEASQWTCSSCYDKTSTLHVHHRQYFKGREPWEYEVGQLEVLCEECHGAHHESEDPLLLATSYVTSQGPQDRSIVAGLVAGFCGQNMGLSHVKDPESYMWGEVTAALALWHHSSLTLSELELLTVKAKDDPAGLVAALRDYMGVKFVPRVPFDDGESIL